MFHRFVLLVVAISLTNQTAYSNDGLLVGIATTDITPAVEDQIPLGGYGSLERRNYPFRLFSRKPYLRSFRIAEGTLDPIRAKAMFIKSSDKKLLFVGLDVIGVTQGMHKDLIGKLASEGFTSSEVIVSGSHTHSGPGALSSNPLWEVIGMDRFQRAYYDKFLQQVVDTVKAAMSNAELADLHTLSFDTENLQNNRRGSDRPLYPRANLLLAKSLSGAWMGGLVNYAVHGTSLDDTNHKFSSDVPGAIETSLTALLTEKNGYVRTLSAADMIFINGAEGDVSPKLDYHELGIEFAKQASAHWEETTPMKQSNWTVGQQEIVLGKPRINISKCVKNEWVPKKLNLGLKKFISSTTLISQVHFGHLWFLTWPGEPTTELGTRLITSANESGAEDAWVFGLSNDHLSYFTTEGEFETGGYEACSNFFGATGGTKVIDAHKELSRTMLKKN